MLKVFCSPSRYTQGPHATEQLGAEIRALGLDGPAIVIAGRSAIRLLSEAWKRTFAAAGMAHEVFPFAGECTAAEIRRGCEAAQTAMARVVVAAGGGKALDTARAIAAALSLPVVNCPTIASSDAPCSALSVIYTEAGAFEEYRVYGRNPDLVLVDTSVIAQSPVRPVSILRQSRRLCDCWPLKGAFSQPLKAKARTTARTPIAKPGITPGIVKLLRPPRQSRGVSRLD